MAIARAKMVVILTTIIGLEAKIKERIKAAIEQVITPTDAQREVWLADHLGREASLAYNEAVELDLRSQPPK